MNNLDENRNNSNQQSAIVQGKGMMIYWSASQLLDYLEPAQIGYVIQKLRNVARGREDTIQLESRMEQDAFDNILAGAVESDASYQAKVERSRRAGKISGEVRRLNAEKQRQGVYQNQRGEYQNKNANEQMFNNRSTFVEQNKAKRSEAKRNEAKRDEENQSNRVDGQINRVTGGMGNYSSFATSQQSVSDEELTASAKKLAEISLRQNTQQNRLPAPKAQLDIKPDEDSQRRAELQREIANLEPQISRQPEKTPEDFTSITDEDAPF